MEVSYSKREFIVEIEKVWPDFSLLLVNGLSLPRACQAFAIDAFVNEREECRATKMLREQLRCLDKDGQFIFAKDDLND